MLGEFYDASLFKRVSRAPTFPEWSFAYRGKLKRGVSGLVCCANLFRLPEQDEQVELISVRLNADFAVATGVVADSIDSLEDLLRLQSRMSTGAVWFDFLYRSIPVRVLVNFRESSVTFFCSDMISLELFEFSWSLNFSKGVLKAISC